MIREPSTRETSSGVAIVESMFTASSIASPEPATTHEVLAQFSPDLEEVRRVMILRGEVPAGAEEEVKMCLVNALTAKQAMAKMAELTRDYESVFEKEIKTAEERSAEYRELVVKLDALITDFEQRLIVMLGCSISDEAYLAAVNKAHQQAYDELAELSSSKNKQLELMANAQNDLLEREIAEKQRTDQKSKYIYSVRVAILKHLDTINTAPQHASGDKIDRSQIHAAISPHDLTAEEIGLARKYCINLYDEYLETCSLASDATIEIGRRLIAISNAAHEIQDIDDKTKAATANLEKLDGYRRRAQESVAVYDSYEGEIVNTLASFEMVAQIKSRYEDGAPVPDFLPRIMLSVAQRRESELPEYTVIPEPELKTIAEACSDDLTHGELPRAAQENPHAENMKETFVALEALRRQLQQFDAYVVSDTEVVEKVSYDKYAQKIRDLYAHQEKLTGEEGIVKQLIDAAVACDVQACERQKHEANIRKRHEQKAALQTEIDAVWLDLKNVKTTLQADKAAKQQVDQDHDRVFVKHEKEFSAEYKQLEERMKNDNHDEQAYATIEMTQSYGGGSLRYRLEADKEYVSLVTESDRLKDIIAEAERQVADLLQQHQQLTIEITTVQMNLDELKNKIAECNAKVTTILTGRTYVRRMTDFHAAMNFLESAMAEMAAIRATQVEEESEMLPKAKEKAIAVESAYDHSSFHSDSKPGWQPARAEDLPQTTWQKGSRISRLLGRLGLDNQNNQEATLMGGEA